MPHFRAAGPSPGLKQVARTADFALRVFPPAIRPAVLYSIAVSKLRRPFLSNRYFFISVRLLPPRTSLTEPDLTLLARASNRIRALHPFYLTAWVFLPDHWHPIAGPRSPETISGVIKSVKQSSMSGINQRRGTEGERWQRRFFHRALRTVEEYNEKVEYIHQNPVRAGLVTRPLDWRWSSFNEYAGLSPEEQFEKRRGPQNRRSALPCSGTHGSVHDPFDVVYARTTHGRSGNLGWSVHASLRA